MALTKEEIEICAKTMDRAFREQREVARLTKQFPKLSMEDGYQIQERLACLSQERGESILGFKMGLTSKAKMEQMKVDTAILGYLTNAMELEDGGELSLQSFIHPKIEPELAFFIKKELKGNVSREEILEASEWVSAALEIIDSRYVNFDFSLSDVLADNCSSSAFVLSKERKSPFSFDLDKIPMDLRENGKSVKKGESSAIYGHPADSLVELLRILSLQGKTLPSQSLVLAGAATAAHPMLEGKEYFLDAGQLGSLSIRVS